MVEEIEEIDSKSQGRRWCFTINNPFGTDIEEYDIETCNIPILNDYYDKSVISALEESNCFVFKYVKITKQDGEFTTKDWLIRRPFFKSIESAQEYIESLESFKYCIFQYEKGEETETPHIQGFIIFNGGKRFRTIKSFLPTAYLEKAKGSNTQCREYCSKSETRIEGPFEFGKFAEERERTDVKEFVELVKSGASKYELSKLYPHLYLKEHNKIDAIRSDVNEVYSSMLRDVDVTYIYGTSGVGKTEYITKLLGLKDVFEVHSYDNSMFTNYVNQDYIVFDEFSGDLKVKTFNLFLGTRPLELRGLGCNKYAAYHHVYFLSNFEPKKLFMKMCDNNYALFKTMNRRVHRILRMTADGETIVERDTVWEDCTDEQLKELGQKKQIKLMYDIDEYGNKIILFNRYGGVPEMQEVKNIDLPFKQELIQEKLEF